MSAFESFWNAFTANFERLPVWLPGTSMEVGDIGTIDKRGFLRVSSLSEQGIAFRSAPLTDAAPEYFVSSAGSRSMDLELSGGMRGLPAMGQTRIGMRAEFTTAGSFILRTKNVTGYRIVDVLSVESEIYSRHSRTAFWDRRWIYVQEVVTGDPVVVLVSASSGGQATVSAVTGGGAADLLSAGGSLALTEQSSLLRYVVSERRTPVMWRGRWLRGFFGDRQFKDRGDSDDVAGEDLSEDEAFEYFDEPLLFLESDG